MYSLNSVLLTAAIALLVGLVAGALIARQLNPGLRKQREMERNLERLLQQQKDYQHEVVEHFTDTAKLLNNLAESYRDVHNHLASGADKLVDDKGGSILSHLPESAMTEMINKPDLDSLQAPLDYAPKTSPYEAGVLNEEFGLDKQTQSSDPTPVPEFIEEAEVSKQA